MLIAWFPDQKKKIVYLDYDIWKHAKNESGK